MRIYCAVRHSIDPRFYYGALWSRNFYPALQQLGHKIVESKIDLLPSSRFMHVSADFTAEELQIREKITQQIIDEVKSAHADQPVDLFLSYFYNAHFDPAGFDELRRLGIPSVNFYCNSIYQFELVKAVSAKVDIAWHTERDARPLYLGVGANPVWVQMGADPAIYHPVPSTRQQTACFVGQRYADRDRWLAALVDANLPLVIYGPGWTGSETAMVSQPDGHAEYLGRKSPTAGTAAAYAKAATENWRTNGVVGGTLRTWRQFRYRVDSERLTSLLTRYSKGPVAFDEQKNIFSSSEVVLNFSNVWADGRPGSKLIPHVRLRDFEAPMCGSCYLTGETSEIHEFYIVGSEIDTYSEKPEFVDKVKFYLSNPAAADRIRRSGYARATRDHTWRRRFEELFRKAGIGTT